MSRKRRRRSSLKRRYILLACVCLALVFVAGIVAASMFDSYNSSPVENAGQQLTVYQTGSGSAQYFVDGQWLREKDTDTLLVIGIDDYGNIGSGDSYNNSSQADFVLLLVKDNKTGESGMIHLNRDTMTDITVLGVNGKKAGTINAQLALAYTYGTGGDDSCDNMVSAVSNLLYGIEIDHYVTVTMDSVPIMNDWVGGVEVEIMDDLSAIDSALVKGKTVRLAGSQALTYVRSRMGLDDSTNLSRMERQRQYAAAWMAAAQPKFSDINSVLEFIESMEAYYYSDCDELTLAEMTEGFVDDESDNIYVIDGESVQGDVYMEYYVNEAELQRVVIELFYEPAAQ